MSGLGCQINSVEPQAELKNCASEVFPETRPSRAWTGHPGKAWTRNRQSVAQGPSSKVAEQCNSAVLVRFTKNGDESPTAEGEPLFDSSGHGDARVVSGQVMCFAKHP